MFISTFLSFTVFLAILFPYQAESEIPHHRKHLPPVSRTVVLAAFPLKGGHFGSSLPTSLFFLGL